MRGNMKRPTHFSVDNTPSYTISKIDYNEKLYISKCTIPHEICDEAIDVCKRNLDLNISSENTKNLIETEKSEWMILHNKLVEPCTFPFQHQLNEFIRWRVDSTQNFSLYYTDWWYAEYTDNSFIAPHCHNQFYCNWSFCAYLDAEDEGTVLYFLTDDNATIPVKVFKGDMLMFPGNLKHWTNDVYKGRKIFAGNFLASVFPNNITPINKEELETKEE